MERMKMNDLKILYRGDIDEAPEGTNVVQLSERTWATGRSGTLKTIAPSDFATEFWQSNPVYQLIRALCLSAEQEERLSGVWVLPNGTELRATHWTDVCPLCGNGYEMHAEGCRAKFHAHVQGAATLWLIAPAPKEPEMEFEVTFCDCGTTAAKFIHENKIVLYWNRCCKAWFFMNGDPGDSGRVAIFDVVEKQTNKQGYTFVMVEPVTRKGEQDGK